MRNTTISWHRDEVRASGRQPDKKFFGREHSDVSRASRAAKQQPCASSVAYVRMPVFLTLPDKIPRCVIKRLSISDTDPTASGAHPRAKSTETVGLVCWRLAFRTRSTTKTEITYSQSQICDPVVTYPTRPSCQLSARPWDGYCMDLGLLSWYQPCFTAYAI